MPTRGLKKSLSYMTLRPGIRVSETVGELTGGAEFGPYDENRVADGNVKITPRTLEVFFGNVDIKFSPNSVYSTIWGANVTNHAAGSSAPRPEARQKPRQGSVQGCTQPYRNRFC